MEMNGKNHIKISVQAVGSSAPFGFETERAGPDQPSANYCPVPSVDLQAEDQYLLLVQKRKSSIKEQNQKHISAGQTSTNQDAKLSSCM